MSGGDGQGEDRRVPAGGGAGAGGEPGAGGGACAVVRDALAAEPQAHRPDVAAHLATCAECTRYADEMLALDARIRRALTIPVPPATEITGLAGDARTADVVPLAAPRRGSAPPARVSNSRLYALAAGVAAVAVAVALLFTAAPRTTLASDVVAHMAEEPAAWERAPAVPAASLAYVLARSGVRLEPGAPEVTYAHSCGFRGRYVPHLAVATPRGVVTVLVLPEERATERVTFDEGGYRGVIVPAPRGALAVLARRPAAASAGGAVAEMPDDATLDEVASRVARAVRYIDRK